MSTAGAFDIALAAGARPPTAGTVANDLPGQLVQGLIMQRANYRYRTRVLYTRKWKVTNETEVAASSSAGRPGRPFHADAKLIRTPGARYCAAFLLL